MLDERYYEEELESHLYLFMAAMGINQHIYELWQAANGNPGYSAFLALDPAQGTTGIQRIIDKGLW